MAVLNPIFFRKSKWNFEGMTIQVKICRMTFFIFLSVLQNSSFSRLGFLAFHFFITFIRRMIQILLLTQFSRILGVSSKNNKSLTIFLYKYSRPRGVVSREAGCCTKSPGFESRLRHVRQTVRTWPYQWLSDSAHKNWHMGGARVALVDLYVRSFPWFSPKHA